MAFPASPNMPPVRLQEDQEPSPHWKRRESDGNERRGLSTGPNSLSVVKLQDGWNEFGPQTLSSTARSIVLQTTGCKHEEYWNEYNLQHRAPPGRSLRKTPRPTHEECWAKYAWLHNLWGIDAAAFPSLKEACARFGMYPALLSDIHKYGLQQRQTNVSQETHSPTLRSRNTPRTPLEMSQRSATREWGQVKCCRKNLLLIVAAVVVLCLALHTIVEEYQSEHHSEGV